METTDTVLESPIESTLSRIEFSSQALLPPAAHVINAALKERAPKAQPGSLISPTADILMIGGVSILFFGLYWLFVDSTASVFTLSWIMFYLSALVNWPHFMASYLLMYGDYRKQILKRPKFLWAAVVVPVLLVSAISVAVASSNPRILSFLVQLMYLSVGWHYVKQIFGTTIVASAARKIYFSNAERMSMRLSLYSLWALSWSSINLTIEKYDFDGIKYATGGAPAWLLTACYVATIGTLLTTIGLFVAKYIRSGQIPAPASITSFAVIYFWYIPVVYHPSYFYLIPFFHSLQYLLFVISFKRNQARNLMTAQGATGAAYRLGFVKKFWGFLGLAAVMGVLAFSLVPKGLDARIPIDAALFGPTLWLFGFEIFINLHHYFIDNVIWRGDNPELKAHLFRPQPVFEN
jgi:hypothetical protein